LAQHQIYKSLISGFLTILFVALWSFSTPADAVESSVDVPNMEPVVVVGTVESSTTGKTVISSDQINSTPTANANPEDLIKLTPGVQISDEANSSLQGGEIIPPLISISGGRPYDNNFQIDGITNNSLLDPGSNNPPNSTTDVPGHPQEIFLNTGLIEKIEVYDNNIPARFGDFSGGVVAIDTIDPEPDFAGSVFYRTTRDSWTSFHIDPAEQTTFESSYNESRQPRFQKQDAGFGVSIPVNESNGFLLSYSVLSSKIPLYHFGQTEEQKRRSENFLLKYVKTFPGRAKLTIQGLHNPYEGEYFIERTKDSFFTINGGGSQVSVEYEQKGGDGHLLINSALKFSENSRKAPLYHRNWDQTASKDWGSLISPTFPSREGGYGSVDKEQKSFESSADWLSEVVVVGETSHQLNAGLQLSMTAASFTRPNTSYAYKGAQVAPVDFDPTGFSCGADSFACDDTVNSEQYFEKRNVYQAVDVDANILQMAIYFDDTIDFHHFEFRPGFRVSYDDFMGNTNFAPRLAAKYDLFGNGRTEFVGGWNRYYSQNLLTYKLRESIIPLVQERTSVVDNDSEWTDSAQTWPSEYSYSNLKTPFSDELVLGMNQSLWGGRLELRYVKRDGDNEFAREKDPFDFTDFNATLFNRLNNDGESHYESIRLSWERQWVSQSVTINATYSETTTSNGSYEDNFELDDFDPDDRVWFKGELLWPDELPREDFNRPWDANLIYSAKLPYGIIFTNVTTYRSGYKGINDSGNTINVNGVNHDVYTEFSRPSSTLFDWKIEWLPEYTSGQTLTLSLDILNVLNRKVYLGPESDEFELGRQFWLGAEYRF